MRKWIIIWIALAGFLAAACSTTEEQTVIPGEDADLVSPSGLFDTGYYSDQAMEIQGVYNGTVMLDVSGMARGERAAFADSLRNDSRKIRDLVGTQIKFGKNQLNTEKLHMNLSVQDLVSSRVELQDSEVWVAYTLNLETILSLEELREAGIDPESFTDREFQVTLPKDPREIFTRVGESCAEGHDEGGLAEYNYFYYFKPDKEGCELPLTRAVFALSSLLPRKTTYPEYHLLTADGKITVAMFFGAADYDDEVSYWDWGMRNHREFIRALEDRGFRFIEALEPKGKRYSRSRANLEEIVDIVSPEDLKALKNDSDGLFKAAMQTHEIVIYNGHSFYGSLSVLDEADSYPDDTYQIFFMYSCWSYEYYTKQVFKNKISARDSNGWDLADVVNNTSQGWFSDMHGQSRILLTNLFKGCETGGSEGVRYYNWDGIIKAMNKEAHQHARSIGQDKWALFGVSGVRTNCYDPADPDGCNGGGGGGGTETRSYPSNDQIDIPDDDQNGIESVIHVPDQFSFEGLSVKVDIQHSYIGDLVVELSHDGSTVVLHSREGGNRENLMTEFHPSGLGGQASAGDWALRVSDRAGQDVGKLRGWEIVFVVPQGQGGTDSRTWENNDELGIPDNDPNGVASTITVQEDRIVRSLKVAVDITHSWVGDLDVELEHDGKGVMLHSRQGDSADSLVREFEVDSFAGESALGTWTLMVSDHANLDSGKLNRWSITLQF